MPFENHDIFYKKCLSFFNELVELLEDYVIVQSCNKDKSLYLVHKGTEDQITYSGKPIYSFRISDHWNWKTSLKKNPDEHYIQCYSKDFPWCKKRIAPGKASPAISACSVCFYGSDNQYHVIYGEQYDRRSKTWFWVETDPKKVLENEWYKLACGIE